MNKIKLAKISLVAVTIVALLATQIIVINYATSNGYNGAITEFAEALRKAGATVTMTDVGDGKYELHVHFPTIEGQAGTLSVPFELHMTVEQWRKGELISRTYHAMALTTLGKNWIADKIGGINTNFAKNATYISVSNSSLAVDVAWTNIDAEITDGGLTRATNSTTDTGDGTWTCMYTFTATATRSTKLYGYSYDSTGGLIAAEQQGTGSQKNLIDGDTFKITVSGAIS